MKLSKKDFQQQCEDNRVRLCFVGMSNIGKSRLAKDLEKKAGFVRFDIDARISERLALRNVRDLAPWLGYPASPNYAEREKEYLRVEEEETGKALQEARTTPGNVVFDTTGSVVYISRRIAHEMKADFLVVHVGASHKDVDELFTTFTQHPKPVLWHGMYSEAPLGSDLLDITTPEAQTQKNLEHSYRTLLSDRLMRYTLLADITIHRFALYKAKTPKDMLKEIEKVL
jgi:shikimate kinase